MWFWKFVTCDPLKYLINHPNFIVFYWMEESICHKLVNKSGRYLETISCSYSDTITTVTIQAFTLKAPITTAADDKFFDNFLNLRKK